MSQVKISVHRPIIVNLDADRKITLPAGVHTVEQEVADHWYVKANSEQLSELMVNADELEAAHEQITDLTAQVAELQNQIELLSAKNAELQSDAAKQNADLTAQVAELQAASQPPAPPATDKKGK